MGRGDVAAIALILGVVFLLALYYIMIYQNR
jgi:hypothetical protein